MDNWDKRVQATLAIWLALAIALGFSGMGDESNFSDEIIAVVVAGAAFLSTGLVWYFGRDATGASAAEKLKRGGGSEDTKTRLLLELLDDDERQTLKNRLMDDLSADGESVSLTDLLAEQRNQQRRR